MFGFITALLRDIPPDHRVSSSGGSSLSDSQLSTCIVLLSSLSIIVYALSIVRLRLFMFFACEAFGLGLSETILYLQMTLDSSLDPASSRISRPELLFLFLVSSTYFDNMCLVNFRVIQVFISLSFSLMNSRHIGQIHA